MKLKSSIFFLLIFYFQTEIYTQTKNLVKITNEDGLSQGMIFDILQTENGFLWFGTKNGLNRYDGYEFKTFLHNPLDSNSISGSVVTSIFEDSRGWMWIGTQHSGLNLFIPHEEQFIQFENEHLAASSSIWDIFETLEGDILVSSFPNTITKIDVGKSKEKQNPNDLGNLVTKQRILRKNGVVPNANFHILKFFLTSKNELFLISGIGLYKIDGLEEIIEVNLPYNPNIENTSIRSIFEDSNQSLWVSAYDQLFKRDDSGEWAAFSFERTNKVVEIFYENDKKIHAARYKEHFLVDINSNTITPTPEINGEAFISSLKDYAGNFWLGTNGVGIRKFNPSTSVFKNHLNGKSLRRMFQSKNGQKWILRTEGFSKYFESNKDSVDLVPGIEFRGTPSITEDGNGYMWSLVQSKKNEKEALLHKFTKTGAILETVKIPIKVDGKSYIDFHHNKLYIAGSNGCFAVYSIESTESKVFNLEDYLGHDAANLISNHLYFSDYNQTCYISSNKGIVAYQPLIDSASFNLFFNGYCHYLIDDPIEPHLYLWAGSKNLGLVKINKSNGSYKSISVKEGLLDNEVYTIIEDTSRNLLWISTNKGLASVNYVTDEVSTYTKGDGVNVVEFNSGCALKDHKGEICFGGTEGMTCFDPALIKKSDFVPPNKIIALFVNGQLRNEALRNTSMTLPHDENVLTIKFATLDFASPLKIKYKYRVKGLKEEWTFIENSRQVTLGPLESGNFRFEVLGTNSSGIWTSDPAQLSFTINPPWWKSKLAYFLYLALMIGLIISFFRYQMQKIKVQNDLAFSKNEAKRVKELEQTKSKFFSNITHEFRTPLSLIIEPARQLLESSKKKEENKKLELITKNSERLLNLVNDLLDLSKMESGLMKVELQVGDIEEHVLSVKKAFEGLAEQKALEFSFKSSLDRKLLEYDFEKVDKVLVNLLSNAFKYTDEGFVNISLTKDQEFCLIRVSDSGVGIAKQDILNIFNRFEQGENLHTRIGTGIGLSIVKEFTELIGGSIQVQSKHGEGSTFDFRFPMYLAPAESFPKLQFNRTVIQSSHILDYNKEHDVLNDKPIILIAEDNDELREFLASSLREDFTIILCENGSIAFEKALTIIPDIILSDVVMPEMDGFDLCNQIKLDARTSHIPIILLTAKSTISSKLKGLKRGADAYLTKPFSILEVIAQIKNLLEQRQLLWKLFQSNSSGRIDQKNDLEIEHEFIDSLKKAIEEHISDENLTVDFLTKVMAVSRTQLHRKLKALTGCNTSEFIRNFKLDKAYEELKVSEEGIAQIAYAFGFNNPKYFSTKFKERFGISPSESRYNKK